jgi:NitT/TauT family transport system ATP-binding protein
MSELASPTTDLTTSTAPAAAPRAAGADERGAAIEVRGVSRRYGPPGNGVLALHEIDLTVAPGAFVCLVGASGCGKSTLLNLVAGLDQPQAGSLAAGGRTALLFQDAALFPLLTARSNIELALRLNGVPRAARRTRANELLASVHLDGVGDRRRHELSGGMRQRVALARALAQDADVLLMDEPFGALDAITRDLLHDELEQLWSTTDLTVLFVTHNVREAVRLGDQVHVLSSRPGRVVDSFGVPLARPRRLDDPEVADLSATIVERLREEVSRHARDRSA